MWVHRVYVLLRNMQYVNPVSSVLYNFDLCGREKKKMMYPATQLYFLWLLNAFTGQTHSVHITAMNYIQSKFNKKN